MPTCWLNSRFHLMSGEVAHQALATKSSNRPRRSGASRCSTASAPPGVARKGAHTTRKVAATASPSLATAPTCNHPHQTNVVATSYHDYTRDDKCQKGVFQECRLALVSAPPCRPGWGAASTCPGGGRRTPARSTCSSACDSATGRTARSPAHPSRCLWPRPRRPAGSFSSAPKPCHAALEGPVSARRALGCAYRKAQADVVVLEVAVVDEQRGRLQQGCAQHPCALAQAGPAVEDAHAGQDSRDEHCDKQKT